MACDIEFFAREATYTPRHNGAHDSAAVRSVALVLKACRATPEQAEAMDDEQWRMAARAVMVKPLSMAGRKSVVIELANLLKRRPHVMRNIRRT